MTKKKELSEFYAGCSLADPRATWDAQGTSTNQVIGWRCGIQKEVRMSEMFNVSG